VAGVPQQFVQPAEPLRIPITDLSSHPNPQAEADLLAEQEARWPFDLAWDLMIQPLLVRLAPDEHRLFLTLHHIACDDWSLNVLESELSTCYQAYLEGQDPDLPPLTEQYTDFAEQQSAQFAAESPHELLAYWRERLADVPALVSLPTDQPRPPVLGHAGAYVNVDIDPVTAMKTNGLARAYGTTPFAVFLAVFASLVQTHSGRPEVIVGSPVANRPRRSLETLIGLFSNTIVLRIDVSNGLTFRELVARTRDESLSAVANQELPFEKLVEELRRHRSLAHNPIFQLMLSYHDEKLGQLTLPACRVSATPGDTETSKLDMILSITHSEEQFSARLEYSTELFTKKTAQALGERFLMALSTAVNNPELTLEQILTVSR
jgi:hypothetical protein